MFSQLSPAIKAFYDATVELGISQQVTTFTYTAGSDPQRDEERNYLLMYLREFATSNGALPVDFDPLVRESFGDLLVAVQSR